MHNLCNNFKDISISILHQTKLRPREVKYFAQGHTASTQSKGCTPKQSGSRVSSFYQLATLLHTADHCTVAMQNKSNFRIIITPEFKKLMCKHTDKDNSKKLYFFFIIFLCVNFKEMN